MKNHQENKDKYTSGTLTCNYAKYRPVWSKEVFQKIVQFRKEKANTLDLAIDVGCGPGISSLPLKEQFSQVIGVDVSENQVSHAPKNVPGLSFRVGDCEDLSFVQSGSVDLVNCAISIHWMDLKKFYPEADRILKPGGAIVAYGYKLHNLLSEHKRVENVMAWVYQQMMTVVPHDVTQLIEDEYKSLLPIYGKWQREESLCLEMNWTTDHLIGLMTTFTSVEEYNRRNPERNLIQETRKRLAAICEEEGLDLTHKFRMKYPVYMVMAHKPTHT